MRMWAVVRFEFEGLHYWPGAFGEVAHLGQKHRHVFKVEAKVEQKHDDRDVEYLTLRSQLLRNMRSMFPLCSEMPCDLESRSCEQLAQQIATWIEGLYPGRAWIVSVFEDGENGAIVEGP